jgi:mRNA-decapping enzyme 1B
MAAQQQQTGKPLPQLDQNSTKELNLTVLQRMDRHVEDILTTAAHVTFYQFSVEDSQWSRKDVEGSLFVVKRRTQPRFQFVVMNRRSTDNLVEDLLGEFEYEVQVPYLLYRNSSQQVHGIWFYNPRECEEVAKLFQRLLHNPHLCLFSLGA